MAALNVLAAGGAVVIKALQAEMRTERLVKALCASQTVEEAEGF